MEVPIRDDHVVQAALPSDAAVQLDHDLRVLPGEELARERVEERHLAAERLRHGVRPPRDGAAHPRRADVREEAAWAALALDAADVDRPRLAVEHRADGVVEAVRNAVRAPEVLARAGGQERDLRTGTRDAVDDLAHRPVSTDDDEERAVRLAGRLGEVSRELRQHLLALQAELGRPLPQLRPALPRRAVPGRRVDEEEDANRR